MKLKRRRVLCKCGCGEYAKRGNRFIRGHNAKIFPPIPKKNRPDPLLCKCGCDQYANSGKLYCWGHNSVGDNNPMKTEEGKKKYKLSMLKKYGVDNNMKVLSFKQKVIDKKRSKLHYHLGNDVTPERIKKLKENCSKAGKIGGSSRAKFWKENPEEFQKFLNKSHDPMTTGSYSGSNHPCWNNGSSLNGYCGAWYDQEYKQDILERDNRQCQNPGCWGTSNQLVIHHIDFNIMDCQHMNLITICRSCHSRIHNSKKHQEWILFYQNLIRKRFEKEKSNERT